MSTASIPAEVEVASDVLDTRQLLQVLLAFRKGDFSVRMSPLKTGVAGKVADTLNDVLDLKERLLAEVERVSTAVGKEGKTSTRTSVPGAAGGWAATVDSINALIGDLVQPTNETARVIGAVAKGDLTQKMMSEIEGRPLQGEFLRTAHVVNDMVDQLGTFASEVTRVAREVGTEGKLGGQALVKGLGGTWKDLTESVNSMAGNLTAQVRNIAEVTTAVASGDLSKKVTVDVQGEMLELKGTINTMVDQLHGFASEVTRVAREVGTEGKLGGQAEVKGVAGTWKDLTDSVNSMASNLTAQVRNIAAVTTAVASGDLSKKITVDVRGEILELKDTVNTMVDQLNAFAGEVTRVAREVGTEGRLGGQAFVKGVGGTWKDLTENVNLMASNLTAQVRNIAEVTTAVANGDLGKKITVDVKGEILELKNTINTMVDQLNTFAGEVTRVAREVGTDGKLGGQAVVRGVAGTWKDLTDSVNFMAGNLTGQVRNIAEVTTAVANGDLSKKITVDVKGEVLELKDTINTMVDQLNAFASEVTRVAREVGTEGRLGGQAFVKGVGGTWKDLTDNVNSMAANLTTQVRSIAKVVTAVANGELKRKLVLEAKGEIAELAETINGMIDTLALFGDQVTTVAREVGIEGKLGGQALVPGAAGLWRDLTNNVNQLAGNLTSQVRAIAEVSTAVTKGDLTRSITVEAAGEVAALKDNINQMIGNLKETTQRNTEQDWLKTNLAKFNRMLQGQRDLLNVSSQVLSELAPLVAAHQGVFYVPDPDPGSQSMKLLGSYALTARKSAPPSIHVGEGLIGQCAMDKDRILLTDVPGDYLQISSALGESTPVNVVVLPIVFEGEIKAVIELASLRRFTDVHLVFLEQLTEGIGIVLNTIGATMQTEQLLKQSQALTEELTQTNQRLEIQAKTLQQSEDLLRNQQDDLRRANEELGERAGLLSQQKSEVEKARLALQEKAEQLAMTSKYKSEFLANMSHELRTPLNSLLILSQTLSENGEENLTGKQVQYAQTIHSAGRDLLGLINDVLDLAKIESGNATVEMARVTFTALREFVERTFRHVAENKQLAFLVEFDPALPPAIRTDEMRLEQVLKNLLSNAFKFTDAGSVTLRVQLVGRGWNPEIASLEQAASVIAFSVVDTGVGIPRDKHDVVFEAFQQADGTTSRKYGGTGLGLSISREIAGLLGGEVRLESIPGRGSTFTLYLPLARSMPERVPVERSGPAAAQKSGPHPSPEGRVVLIVAGVPASARELVDRTLARGFSSVVADRTEAALKLARELDPAAIVLDIGQVGREGWSVLDRVKHETSLQHIPVLVVAEREHLTRALEEGAFACVERARVDGGFEEAFGRVAEFMRRSTRDLLLIDDDGERRTRIAGLLGSGAVQVTAVGGADAEQTVGTGAFDCVVLGMSDVQADRERLRNLPNMQLPVLAYAPDGLSATEEAAIRQAADSMLVEVVTSEERLLAEATLRLHRPSGEIPIPARKAIERIRRTSGVLFEKRVLVVDDDIRNIFALSTVLERYGMQVSHCENGRDAVARLESGARYEVILMDIMMPEMDGYETTRAIRRIPALHDVPIFAVTAKAMKGDLEKCLEAGASDYITKPVDIELLLSRLRVWLHP